jgi:signal transduction histidine kinase
MKKFIWAFLVLGVALNGYCQNLKIVDSLKQELRMAKKDARQASIANEIAMVYRLQKPDSGIYYAQLGLKLARRYHSPEDEGQAFYVLGFTYTLIGNYPQAIQMLLKARSIAEKHGLTSLLQSIYTNLGSVNLGLRNYPRALLHLKKAYAMNPLEVGPSAVMTRGYTEIHQLDSANRYAQIAFKNLANGPQDLIAYYRILRVFGRLLSAEGKFLPAIDSLKKSYHLSLHNDDLSLSGRAMLDLANVFFLQHRPDSAQYYAKQSLMLAQKGGYYQDVIDAGQFLSTLYEPFEPQKALFYNQIASTAKDNLLNLNNKTSIKNLFNFDEQERRYEINQATTAFQNQVKIYALIIGLAVMLLIGLILLRTYRKENNAKILLQAKNETIESNLLTLQSTQAQLIQSEKLASLGELTAGIAHEIQNPLNFVNNFSELSVELAEELKEEIQKPDIDKGLIEELATDLAANQEKINLHGQRASAIVKSMLEHSRVSKGKKEPTDLNVLADEYLRRAYHGLRAKESGFNATMETHFDPDLPKIEVIPQDISRVLLNLINNAFYAVNEKAKLGIKGYQPTIIVSTKKREKGIEISIQDNGSGIPDSIKDKIFQPFFTTKAAGQGTGLGLSLAYDIVTKGHGGSLDLISTLETGAKFTIFLPGTANNN